MGAPSESMDKKSTAADSKASSYLSLVQQYLAVFQVDNAIFLAERCVAEFPDNSDAIYLLALSHYRNNSPKTARQILQQSSSPSQAMQFLSAQCSLDLKDYPRAEISLMESARLQYKQEKNSLPTIKPMDEWIMSTTPCPVPNGAVGLAMLGKICRLTGRRERAKTIFEMSLRLDPFLWTSYEALAELGSSNEFQEFLGPNSPGHQDISVLGKSTNQPLQTPAPPKATTRSNVPTSAFRNRNVHFETPGLTPIPVNNSVMPAETPKPSKTPLLDAAVLRKARDVVNRQYYPPTPETPAGNATKPGVRYLKGEGWSSDLADHGRLLFGENQTSNVKKDVAIGTETALSRDRIHGKDTKENKHSKVSEILELLCAMGKCYREVCGYQCKRALLSIQNLPAKQQVTGWVLHQQGRAHLELNDFASAERSLQLMQIQDPGRMKGLELLSTVYWQLKKEVDLAHLAQKVTEWDRLSPEAWCVVGNCFSLQKDHESALLFFRRSLQLDPEFTYTHTLAGYEYMANEDFDKAIACFRQALRTDDRHYNAWYGLGAIYQRQEKYDLAEYHFERAVDLNPSSSALRCNLGMAQFSNGKAYVALDSLRAAFDLDPRNPQARFQRANIFMALHRADEALIELQKVRDAVPREATVHFSMGKVYKKLGRTEEALKCFLTAMDLDPKGNQAIKSALEKLEDPDGSEESGEVF